MFWRKIKSVVTNPLSVSRRLKGILRHSLYPSIDSSAIVIKPLLFTAKHITLGKNTFVFNNARIEGVTYYAGKHFRPQIKIGEGTTIQQNCHITCANLVQIGEYCAITHNVTITDIDHSYEYSPYNYPPPICNPLIVRDIRIGGKCMIFANAVILGGTSIGNNCVVAANSVLRGNYPDNSVIAGSPAIIIKRYNEITGIWERTNPDGSFIE